MAVNLPTTRTTDRDASMLRRIGSLRRRLNSLVVQRTVFQSLALIVCVAALEFLSASALTPIEFIAVSFCLIAIAAAGLFRSIRTGWQTRVSPERAAGLADARAELKGRLQTVVAFAGKGADASRLWPYLIEDASTLSERFEPSRIEPRLVSRSIYGLIAACLVAAVALLSALANRHSGLAMNSADTQLQMDVNELEVRPADSDLDADAAVTGGANAMAALADKLAQAQGAGGAARESGPMGNFIGKARRLAGDLQNRLAGRGRARPRINLRVTDSGKQSNRDVGDSRPHFGRHSHENSGQFERETRNGDDTNSPPLDSSPQNGTALAPNGPAFSSLGQDPRSNGTPHDDTNNSQLAQNDSDDSGTGGGASHGSGSDPQHLFGKEQEPQLGSEGFEITVEARPVERGSSGAGQSYLPPKVRAPLNDHQYPDQPIVRNAVPYEDRATIKRIFER